MLLLQSFLIYWHYQFWHRALKIISAVRVISPGQTKNYIVAETFVILDVSSNVSMFAHPWKHCCGNICDF